MAIYELPKLPYAYDALEPYIDKETVEIHYSKHHQAYLNKLLETLEGHENLAQGKSIEMVLSDLSQIPEEIRQKIINFGGGYANHNMYWFILSPNGGGEPGGKLLQAINDQYGNYDNFKNELGKAAKGVFGSGWAWLVVCNDSKNLEIMTTQNQDSPYSFNKTPLIIIDVWEHAYYLGYQNRRADYVDRFFNLLNWDEIEHRYEEAMNK
ncbi:superoxide dismutase [Mycoplasmatota bacterium]|nr:superoxide dismutase [Mycoplasmatota bacterium]